MVTMTQEEILLSLVRGDEGKKWAVNRIGWKESSMEKVCDWESVECDTRGRIISLLLTGTNLSASIPAAFGKLSSLKTLRFGTNKLYGPLPKEFAALSNLVNLDISDNRLTGTIPLLASPSIRTIDLGHNDFHGSIPAFIALTDDSILQRLVLAQNRLSGTIPETLSAYSNLNMLDLSSNNLHGAIPTSIGDLHLLQHLHLNNNFLIGPIPTSLAIAHPGSGRIADLLEEIHLNDNFLSGTVPVQLADLPKLKQLIIYENKLTGDVPADICSVDVNSHFFQNVDKNDPNIDYCDAISCPQNTVATDGVYPCTNCKNPHYNPYIGQMRSCNTFTKQRSILKKFYDNTSDNGKWSGDDGDNWSMEDTFLCDFTGVTCDENYNVIAIELKNRGLKGTIPYEIGFLQYLEKIDLSDNDLSGFLPSDFRWAPLKEFDISGNKIRGLVPPKLCLQYGLNGNGENGQYNCDHIACPAYTYHPYGRKIASSDYKCVPCEHSPEPIIGSRTCRQVGIASGVFGIVVVLVTMIITLSIYYFTYLRRMKYLKIMNEKDGGNVDGIELGNNTPANTPNEVVQPPGDHSERRKTPTRKNSMMNRKQKSHRKTASLTRTMINKTNNLPYPDAAVSQGFLKSPGPNKSLTKSRSNRSTGSGSGTSVSGASMSGASIGSHKSTKSNEKHFSSNTSVTSNKSGKISVGSEGSSKHKDLWLDVPNIS